MWKAWAKTSGTGIVGLDDRERVSCCEGGEKGDVRIRDEKGRALYSFLS